MLPLEPSFGSQTEYSDSYTVQIDNYDSAFQWAVSVTSGTASIDSSGLITVSNPVGASMITVTTNRNRYPEGSASNAYASLTGNRANAVWQSMPGNASSNVFNGGSIFDVAINPVNGDIYVGGSFTNVNGDPAADYIMRFDGTQWLSVPGGFSNGSGEGSNGIFALAFDATGKLYAGGKFANAGGDANADNLAQWDGTSWSAVGQTSFNGSLRAIEILGDGRVLVGGQFTAAAGITGANYIAAWNGSAWSKIGTTVLTGYVRSMTHSRNGGIYIGGFFTNVGGDSDADNVVQLINGDWARVGVPPTGENVAVSIAVDDSTSTDKLYIGGYFYSDEMSRRLLKWDGQTWTAPDIGLNGDVRALTYSRNYGLFLGGWFTKSANNRFGSGLGLLVNDVLYGIGDSNNNGTGMEGALRNDVYSLALTSDNQIIAAGEFTSVAGVAYTNRIARTASWTPPVNLLPTETSTPNASDTSTTIANAQAIREAEIRKQAKIDSAFASITKTLKAGETFTVALAQEAELACFTSANIGYANSALLSASVESRTAKTFIDGISKRLCILNDLTSARPQTNSVRQMVDYGVMPANTYKPSLTLKALRKLPLASRSTYADIQVAIAKIQSEFLAKKKLLDARLKR
ncbi:unannotated protein [freshwater metagenome]|uniref:Unannotated protein n=1 Tax=freshwater metagenome TaxID=449393 RepID=A0A6J7F495_9ZZZZ